MQAHVRRFKKFCELAKASNEHSRDPRKVAAAISRKPIAVTNSDGQSKRALKRVRSPLLPNLRKILHSQPVQIFCASKKKQKLDSIKRRREKTKQIIQRKKRKHAKQEAEAEGHGGVHEEGKNSDAGSSKSRPQTSVSDKQASERPRKRRKVAGSDGKEAPRENTSDTQGGDSTKAGDQTETRERVVVVASAEPKPSKAKPKKVKAKGKSESSAKVKPDAANAKDDGEEQATNTATKQGQGDRSKTARFFEHDGAVEELSSNGSSPRTTKKPDLEKLRTKGHLGKAGSGKFAKLSGTRAVKDKSQRKAPTQGDTARNSLAPKKPTRYFDGAEDGTSSGPKVSSTEKLEQGRKTKSEGKRNNSAKGDGANRIKTAESYGQEKAADDLVIFD